VESIWPSLMKVGPRLSSSNRNRTAWEWDLISSVVSGS
jgi:hypothetical protein